MSDDFKGRALILANQRHGAYTGCTRLELMPYVRDAYDFVCRDCDAKISVSGLELAVSVSDSEILIVPDPSLPPDMFKLVQDGNTVGTARCDSPDRVNMSLYGRTIQIDRVELATKDPDRWIAELDQKAREHFAKVGR